MAKFSCTIRQDAWIFWNIAIEADNAEEAAKKAREAWRHGDANLVEEGHEGFDEADCEADDCEQIENEETA